MPSWKKVALIDKDATLNELTLNQVNNNTGDFITITNQGVISKRTPTQTLQDIGGQPSGNYIIEETDPTVPQHVKDITTGKISNWDSAYNRSVTNFDVNTNGILTITRQGISNLSVDLNTWLTNPITGTGTNNFLPKFTGASTLGNSLVFDNGTNVGIGTTSPSERLHVSGNIRITNSLLSNQENLDVDTGALRLIAQISSTNHDAAFFDFVIKKGTNLRAGTVYAVHNGTIVEFTETSTNDLGNTDEVVLSVDLSGGNIRLLAQTDTDDWQIKTLVRGV